MSAKVLSLPENVKSARTVECEVSSVERLLLAMGWKRVDSLWQHETLDKAQPIEAAFAGTLHAIIKGAEAS